MNNSCTIVPIAENAALVSFGNVIDEKLNKKIIAIHHTLLKEPFAGFVESVPAYSSLGVFYNHTTTFEIVKSVLERLLASQVMEESSDNNTLRLPVFYNGEDLPDLAEQHRLTTADVIEIHSSKAYRVFMIGFLPGFSYMGTIDERIATPRKKTPRTLVPAGSVGIAGVQTGIYPQASPGGWQLIGRTPIKIFDATKESPCLIKPGDLIKFYPIDKTEFDKLNEY